MRKEARDQINSTKNLSFTKVEFLNKVAWTMEQLLKLKVG
jgi:hypothetical protein